VMCKIIFQITNFQKYWPAAESFMKWNCSTNYSITFTKQKTWLLKIKIQNADKCRLD
jgi:hypothetical protein